MGDIRFDGQVALVTGGGRGMGRDHCLFLAERGAKVVVNDFGVKMSGDATAEGPADEVVAEIKKRGGEAIADRNDVSSPEGAKAMVDAAVDTWGRIDIVVHNAGIVTFNAFGEMSYEQFRKVTSVHLDGGFLVSRMAWPHMVKQKYGRILLITSQAALCGLPNLAHYGAAKTGLTGLSRAISLEGAEHGIQANSLAVMAYTRQMEGFFTDEDGRPATGMHADTEGWWKTYARSDIVSPVVAWLTSRDCKANGEIFHTAAGLVAHQFLTMTSGFSDIHLTPESIRDNEAKIFDRSGGTFEFHDSNEITTWQFNRVIQDNGIPAVPGS